MLSKYSAIQMLVPHASYLSDNVMCSGSFCTFICLGVGSVSSMDEDSVLRSFVVLRAMPLALQAVLSLLHAQNACVISCREYMFSKHPSLPAAPLYDLSSYC